MSPPICPTCHQVVPENPSLPARVRAALSAAPGPLKPIAIRRLVETSSAVLYQTLRRMEDRGEIRRSTNPSLGSGWVLVPNSTEIVPVDAHSTAEVEGEAAQEVANHDLSPAHTEATWRMIRDSVRDGAITSERSALAAVQAEMGVGEVAAYAFLDAMAQAGAIRIDPQSGAVS